MKYYPYILLCSLCCLNLSAKAQTDIQSWGHYTAGCIPNASALAKDGEGYHIIRLHRQRYYGHPKLLHNLEQLAQAMQPYGKQILIGDMSQRNGGRMPSGHRSHQTGLDADILLQGWDNNSAFSEAQREALEPVSLLNADAKSLNSSRLTPWHQQLIQQAALLPDVERIFLNPLIKQALCETQPNAPWLKKIRPWWGHDGHLHIRLNCPTDSPNCHNQAPVAESNGCDASLAWWVQQITAPTASTGKKPTKPKNQPILPKVCRGLSH